MRALLISVTLVLVASAEDDPKKAEPKKP